MQTQSGLRPKIVFVGQVNVGKSSLINALVGEKLAIVSDIAGTTTDSLSRAYEILGYGPVTICDTAGFGDITPLGMEREKGSLATLKNANVAVLVVDKPELDKVDLGVLEQIRLLNIPYLIIYNKSDINQYNKYYVSTDTLTKKGLNELRDELVKKLQKISGRGLLDGVIEVGDNVLLVMPQDSSAPKGRLILPQVQMIRALLDVHAMVSCVQFEELGQAMTQGSYDLIITDSKIIKEVLSAIPVAQKVSTFSVLFARAKGDFETFLSGTKVIDMLQDGDKILIAEACVHTTNEDDIAKAMLPKVLQKRTGKKLIFEFSSGKKLPEILSDYKLILQCGGCMLTPKEMQNRIDSARATGVSITNYGLTITKCQVGDITRLTF